MKQRMDSDANRISLAKTFATIMLFCGMVLGLAACAASDPQVEPQVKVQGQYDVSVGRATRP